MRDPIGKERSQLVVQMRQLLKQTGPYTSFRRSDFGHDEEFIKKRWTGEPLLWIPYSGGTHMMRLGGRTTIKQRDEILAVIDGMLQEQDAHFFIIEGPRFPPREIEPRQIRDYIIDMMEAESRGEPFDGHGTFQDNVRAQRYGVPFLLSFDPAEPGRFRMGRGEAGYTVKHFASAGEALEFAESIPRHARVRAHERLIRELEEAASGEHESEALERSTFRDNAARMTGRKKLGFAGYEFESGGGMGTEIKREYVDVRKAEDYGADPLGDGTFRMVPSGDIVDLEERNRRLGYTSNADYYVWPLSPGRNTPLAGYGPYGPFDMMTAKTYARARSQEGTHDNAVTRGQDPQRFELERIYQAGTGQRLFPRGSEGFEANED